MGFLGSPPPGSPPPFPLLRRPDQREFIWLAALGRAACSPAEREDIHASLDDLVGHLWLPSPQAVADCLDEMLRSGALRALPGADGLLETTAAGLETLSLLMTRPDQPFDCPLGQIGLRLKMAFLDRLPPADRHHHLSRTILACNCALVECRRRSELCAAYGAIGQLWLDHESDRLRRDLALLHSLTGGDAAATAAADGPSHHV